MLIPQTHTIISTVDELHRGIRYTGGRLDIRTFCESYPGFLLTETNDVPERTLACLIRSRGCSRILYRGDIAKTRQRFAVAQQIGAAVLHACHLPGLGLTPSTRHTTAIKERQAKLFASALLCPLWALELALPDHYLERQPCSRAAASLVRGMAVRFGVSQAVIRTQLKTYGQIASIHR